jgi:hypothetical protein
MHAGAMSHVYFSGDDVVNGFVADILDLLDYMDRIDAIEATPPPPPLRRQVAGLLPVEVIDLTCDEDIDDIPVASRLDFTVIVDEVDNGGYFRTSGAYGQGHDS